MTYLIIFLIALVPGLIAFLLTLIKKEYRIQIFGIYIVVMIIANIVFNCIKIPELMPLRTTTNQFIYQSDYMDTKEYPDALLQLLIKNKRVYVKDDFKSSYDTELLGFDWLYSYFHQIPETEYLKRYNAEVIQDSSINNSVIDDNVKDDFTLTGYANDMLRNAFMFHPDKTTAANYFYHYVYFSETVGPMNFYINFDNITDSSELVLLWQNVSEDDETEELYLMTKDYYDSNVK